ncbi:MAG: L-arabinose ABC transporter ATP-binding protein AraG [Ignavibacteria bacterium]|nr:L-arabinose ABC transporter ATP-binding protein AraG [Ignavibacteria bacterium]MBI3766561.1 L-arabinose ABC transporter ATP-binding protein AraG [Ignavibacteriales bacterium]
MTHCLQFESVSKSFPGVKALDSVNFSVAAGSVHALLGENGAGKSTLLKILSSIYRLDNGKLLLNDAEQHFRSAADAIHAGIAVIYQELHLVPEMSVAENLFLGHLPCRYGIVDRKTLQKYTLEQLTVLGEDIPPSTKVSRLPVAQRQMVEIAKALTRRAKVIAFDEPTSSLSDQETKKLFAIIRELKNRGHMIIYVSHRLEEIFEICDAATVLRDGQCVETFSDMSKVTSNDLVQRMVGRPINDIYHYERRPHGGSALEVRELMGPGLAEPASFSVEKGEILGVFGLIGAGRTELLKLTYGATRATAGTVSVAGKPLRLTNPSTTIRSGLMFCSEDRKKEGIFPLRSVMENINLSTRHSLSVRGWLINERRERENASRQVEKLIIKTPSLRQLIVYLSGGNQQKVVLARWLSAAINVMLLDEPTRGIDVGAKSEIYSIIYDLARQGIGIVVVSSELPEVLGISDRILVMREGRIVASLLRSESNEERLLYLALPPTPSSGVRSAV